MKYFVSGDVHGFCTLWKEALRKQGFDIEDPEHIVVLCGDAFDRGPENVEVFKFLKQLKSLDRLIYIRGNHEDLLFDCVDEYKDCLGISHHHVHNGTIYTTLEFDEEDILDEVLDFINENCVNYYEIKDYIFVHGWIPINADRPWRDATEQDWIDARWKNGMEAWKYGWRDAKTVVCGHWCCSYGWSVIDQKRKEFPQKNQKDWEKSFEPWINTGIIALDGCTKYSNIVNVVVLEEDND